MIIVQLFLHSSHFYDVSIEEQKISITLWLRRCEYAQGALLQRQRQHNVPLILVLSLTTTLYVALDVFVLSHTKKSSQIPRRCPKHPYVRQNSTPSIVFVVPHMLFQTYFLDLSSFSGPFRRESYFHHHRVCVGEYFLSPPKTICSLNPSIEKVDNKKPNRPSAHINNSRPKREHLRSKDVALMRPASDLFSSKRLLRLSWLHSFSL